MLRDNIFSYLILKLSSGGTLDRETLFVRGDAYAADAAAHVQAVLRRSTLGSEALRNNTTGSGNIAIGVNAGLNLTTGSNNIDIGNTGVAGESNTIRMGVARG